jgi:hypothetical protein
MKKYIEYRDQIQSGDLLAWSHRGWRTWHDFKIQMVRLFTQSEYSHVGIAWVVGGRVFVIEAVEPMVRAFPLSKLGSFYITPLNAAWEAETEEAALGHIGADYKQLVAIEAYFRCLPEGTVSECAALVIDVMRRDGIFLGRRATPDAVVREAQMRGGPTYLIEA